MDEQTKKDFLNIMKLAARKDIADNKDILRKIIRINDTTDNFKSAFGKKFIHRVKTILSGDETEFTCILCGKDKACNGFICKSCMDRYNKGVNKNSQGNVAKTKKSNDHRSDKKIYRKSVFGTIMYNITSIGNKKILKQRRENNPEYQKPVSGHVFIGLYTIILLLTYLFNIYAGGIFLLLGLDIDNNTHNVSSYSRFRNGKWENVKEYTRRNPDDIINNNLSYRGDNPYDGTNPIRNGRK